MTRYYRSRSCWSSFRNNSGSYCYMGLCKSIGSWGLSHNSGDGSCVFNVIGLVYIWIG